MSSGSSGPVISSEYDAEDDDGESDEENEIPNTTSTPTISKQEVLKTATHYDFDYTAYFVGSRKIKQKSAQEKKEKDC